MIEGRVFGVCQKNPSFLAGGITSNQLELAEKIV